MFKNIIILVVSVLVVVLFLKLRALSNENNRLEQNQIVLFDTINHYKVRDSLNAASVQELQLKVGELRQYRSRDTEMIRSLGVRLSRVQSVENVALKSSYDLKKIPLTGLDKWGYKTDYIDFTVELQKDTLVNMQDMNSRIIIYDTIVQVLHRVPRFKFLGIWFGTKGVRQEIVSCNPYTKIVAAEYLTIVK